MDFGRTSKDYATHRAGFPPTFVERLVAGGVPVTGRLVVDVGTGTGTLARLFAQAGCEVIALDPARSLLEEARTFDAQAGVSIRYLQSVAEETGLAGSSADIYSAGQCWHWFDRPRAALEAHRVLRPGGHLVVAHFDWLPLPNTVGAATEALIRRHNPAWTLGGGTGIYPAWTIDAASGGFTEITTFSFDVDVTYSHESWRGRIRASAGVGGSLTSEGVQRFDEEHAGVLRSSYGDPLVVPHRVWSMTARRQD